MEMVTEVSGGVVRVRSQGTPLEAAEYVAALAGIQQGQRAAVRPDDGMGEVEESPRLFAVTTTTAGLPASPPPPVALPVPTPTAEPTASMVFELPRRHAQAVEETGLKLTTIASVKEYATGPGYRVRLTMDSEGAVKLYEAMAEAIKTVKLPGLYTTRRELQHALDAHFGIHGEAG